MVSLHISSFRTFFYFILTSETRILIFPFSFPLITNINFRHPGKPKDLILNITEKQSTENRIYLIQAANSNVRTFCVWKFPWKFSGIRNLDAASSRSNWKKWRDSKFFETYFEYYAVGGREIGYFGKKKILRKFFSWKKKKKLEKLISLGNPNHIFTDYLQIGRG